MFTLVVYPLLFLWLRSALLVHFAALSFYLYCLLRWFCPLFTFCGSRWCESCAKKYLFPHHTSFFCFPGGLFMIVLTSVGTSCLLLCCFFFLFASMVSSPTIAYVDSLLYICSSASTLSDLPFSLCHRRSFDPSASILYKHNSLYSPSHIYPISFSTFFFLIFEAQLFSFFVLLFLHLSVLSRDPIGKCWEEKLDFTAIIFIHCARMPQFECLWIRWRKRGSRGADTQTQHSPHHASLPPFLAQAVGKKVPRLHLLSFHKAASNKWKWNDTKKNYFFTFSAETSAFSTRPTASKSKWLVKSVPSRANSPLPLVFLFF